MEMKEILIVLCSAGEIIKRLNYISPSWLEK